MGARPKWVALRVLAILFLSMLAPSSAGGNIGCLFSSSVCTKLLEWCYDDNAFGKCISIYQDEPEDKDRYDHQMTTEQLKTFEAELQSLVDEGYRWEHAFTQCVLQSMLFAARQNKKYTNIGVCEPLKDPDIISSFESERVDDNNHEPPSNDVAIIHYAPPMGEDLENEYERHPMMKIYSTNYENPSIRKTKPTLEIYDPPLVLNKKAKKQFDTSESQNVQKFPYTAEYLMSNRYVTADENDMKDLINMIKKYKESYHSKHLPLEYEENNESPPTDGESYKSEFEESENVNYANKAAWKLETNIPENVHKTILTESGEAITDPKHKGDILNLSNEEIRGLMRDYELGFKRRERLDVKKPGPPWDNKSPSLKSQQNVTDKPKTLTDKNGQLNKYNKNIDTSYAYITFQNGVTTWADGLEVIQTIQKMLRLEQNAFSHPRINVSEVSFKVEPNRLGYDAKTVAEKIVTLQGELDEHLGIVVTSVGIGDMNKAPMVTIYKPPKSSFINNPLTVMMLASFGILTLVLTVTAGAIFFFRRNKNNNNKGSGLATAAQIDAEASKDYQDMCRLRMSRYGGGNEAGPATRGPREHDASPSARSSTSSWSEEPALTNMDISTGHMVLAYMEDHLKNKDRLEQEWKGLCAYEAEPCATTAANKEENLKKNRYPDIVPYDHSRVVLNTITNQNGSDYINASSITDHDPRNPAYIAAQGPMEHTAADFWQLIWEQGSVVTVLLTRLQENGTSLCYRYWPDEGSQLYHIYEVHLVSEHIWCDDYLVRSFYLKNLKTSETRTVTQFHFLSWPDSGVPASTKALLEFRRKVNKSYRGRSCPIVVHCSDGAGRTGTYCLIDMVLNRMAKGAKEIDIAATLEHIRDQRPNMVSTKQQFEFVLMAVAEEVHAILKSLPAQLQQQEKKDSSEKEK